MKTSTLCNLKGTQKVFFIHLNRASSCCRSYPEAIPSDMSTLLQHWKTESDQLAQGIRVQSCSVCWKDEEQGQTSYRQQHGHNNTNTIDVFMDNSCNQMCSYCSPKFSSTWHQNIIDHGPFRNIGNTAKSNLVLPTNVANQDQWIKNLREYLQSQPPESVDLAFLGGEPLMQLRNLQTIVELASNSIRKLTINTNLNPPNNRFLVWLLDNIPIQKLKFDISLDATPEYNHIPRAGFDANKFKSNLRLLIDRNINFQMLSVISVLSIFDLPNFINWAKSYHVIFNKINNPSCLDPLLLPNHIIDQVGSQFKQEPPLIFQDLYKNSQPKIDLKLFEQYNYLCQYFFRTGMDPKQIDNPIFQQYWTWLTEKQK